MFEASTYSERRRQLCERIGSGVTMFVGNDLTPMNYADNPYPFWQDRSFLYYWGLDEPGLVGLLDADSGEAILFGHDPTIDEVVWTGPQPSLASKAERVGASGSAPIEEVAARIEALRSAGRKIHQLPLYRAASRIGVAGWLGIPVAEIDSTISR